jgi:hypothetical protein
MKVGQRKKLSVVHIGATERDTPQPPVREKQDSPRDLGCR